MRVLHVEDDDFVAELFRRGLKAKGIVLDRMSRIEDAVAALDVVDYDAVVLDLTLQDGDGLAFLKRVRRVRNMVPVIVISARGTVADKVQALSLGADDYVAKPIQLDELAARLFAMARRPQQLNEMALRLGNLSFEPHSSVASVGDQRLTLTRRESVLLGLLIGNVGRPMPRETIGDRIYGFGEEVASNAVEVLVFRLRARLQKAGADVKIVSSRGFGYMLEKVEGVDGRSSRRA